MSPRDELPPSTHITSQVRSARAQHLADLIVLSFGDSPASELTTDQEALILKTERLIKRVGGIYKKRIARFTNDIAYDFQPMVLMIPIQNKRLVRLLSLINTFDETIVAIDAAWLHRTISIGDHGDTIRKLEGRVYKNLNQLDSRENTHAKQDP